MSRRSRKDEHLFRETVFRQMFESHFTRVVRYVEGQTGNHAAAEDIASEVFAVAWKKLDPDDPFGLPWLIRTAMYKTRDFHRREFRGAAVTTALERLLSDAAPDVSDLDRLALSDAMSRLTEKDLQIVRLTYWDGLTAGEVAQVLRMREGAIWTRLHRARAHLRVALTDGTKTGSRHE